MINIDQLSDDDLDRLRKQFAQLGDQNGGCDELEADVSAQEDLQVRVRTEFDSKGKLESREIERAEKRQLATKIKREDDDHTDQKL